MGIFLDYYLSLRDWVLKGCTGFILLTNMISKYSNKIIIGIMVLFMSLIASSLQAQTPPVDLTELGIEKILSLHILRQPDGLIRKTWADRWSVGYRYIRVEYKDYRDGTKHKSAKSLKSQFTNVPEKIVQEMHLTEITFNASDKLNLSLLAPYIQQKTDHLSNTTGFNTFRIRTDGIGDISLNTSYVLDINDKHRLMPSLGISIPSGSIDEKGDTNFPGTRNQLPYTMQLGSGTFDPLIGVNYTGNAGRITWGGGLQGKFRVGRNERGYSLSDRLLLTAWIRARLFYEWLEPSFKLTAHISSSIDGADSDLPPPGRVPVATPRFFGGEKVIASPGVKIRFKDGMFKGRILDMEAGLPIYQSTNGPFPSEEWRLSIGFNWHF